MKNILIIGKDSYVGEHFKEWLDRYPGEYNTDIVSSIEGEWKKADWSSYQTVVDFAGVAHINNITDDMKGLFYSVNKDLSIEIAKWCKKHKVKHFILFSSMNVYGDSVDNLKDINAENPTSFYGDSKLQGDLGVRKLEDNSFFVSYIRPPFIYGKGCKGNYNVISKIAKKTPIFPTYNNKKSMIFIDNLCEFVRLVVDEKLYGILTPQNKELVSTTDLVREIAKCNNKKICFTGLFNWLIKPAIKLTKTFRRAFGDDCYDLSISNYWDFKYCVTSFSDSIKQTEGR